jgi:hypothetical protein
MTKNELNPEEEQEEQIEEETEETEETPEETKEDSKDSKETLSDKERIAKAEAEAAKYRRLFEKAQKKPAQAQTTGGVSREEVEELLLKKEYDEEELEEIKDLARGKNISYSEALATPLFQSWKAARDAEKRRSDASLGSSKGGSYSVNKGVPTDRDEHRAYWNKIAGN